MNTALQPCELSAAEVDLVMRARALAARQDADQVFRGRVIKTAADFWEWSQAHGVGLTFSTFVNTFGYDGADHQAMFRAVKCLIEALHNL